MGWALNKPKTGLVRFNDKVQEYLIFKFDCGEKTGEKANPTQVSPGTRSTTDDNGMRYFSREDWLNPTQIKGFSYSNIENLSDDVDDD